MLLIKSNRLPNSSPAAQKDAIQTHHWKKIHRCRRHLMQRFRITGQLMIQVETIMLGVARVPTGNGTGFDIRSGQSNQTQLWIGHKMIDQPIPPVRTFKRYILMQEDQERKTGFFCQFIVDLTDPLAGISIVGNHPFVCYADGRFHRSLGAFQQFGTN